MNRKAIVDGQFYPSDPKQLSELVRQYTTSDTEPKKAMGIVSPHAGFMYSGEVAGAVYSTIKIPKRIIIIGPNHTGLGESASIVTEGEWEMPNGKVKIDTALANEIIKQSSVLKKDQLAHLREHSLEVQLPFIQFLTKEFKMVPISIMTHKLADCLEIGTALARAIKDISEEVLIVASTDMTHYEPHETAKIKDHLAIDKILKLDAQGLFEVVRENRISMCGVMPTITTIVACKQLGATKVDLVRYMTSGDISGDKDQVVGYAGLVIF
ncbi:MAG: AmmeMemoRadiSam system protein B [bacterium]